MNTDITYMDRKNRSTRKNKSGVQNIKQVVTGWQVLIGSIYIGVFPTLEEAIIRRDAAREKQGLPKASY